MRFVVLKAEPRNERHPSPNGGGWSAEGRPGGGPATDTALPPPGLAALGHPPPAGEGWSKPFTCRVTHLRQVS